MPQCFVAAADAAAGVLGVGLTPEEAARSFADRYVAIYGASAPDATVKVEFRVFAASPRECREAVRLAAMIDGGGLDRGTDAPGAPQPRSGAPWRSDH